MELNQSHDPEEFDLSKVRKMKIYLVCPQIRYDSLKDETLAQIMKETGAHIRYYKDCQSPNAILRVSAYERYESRSPTSMAAISLSRHCTATENSIYNIEVLIKEKHAAFLSSETFSLWRVVNEARITVTQDRGHTVVKISGQKINVNETFMQFVDKLRDSFFKTS